MAKGKQSSSKEWLQRHINDPYVKLAQSQGFRSRAAFKLLELQEKYHFLGQGMKVVDLGAAPGSWCQVARRCVGSNGHVVAVDLLPMDAITGVEFKQADFTDPETVIWIKQQMTNGGGVDAVISDLSPNLSGIWVTDQARSMDLAERVWWFSAEVLKTKGSLLIKVFQGPGIDELVKELRQHFQKVVMRKPKASRPQSREFYILAIGFKRSDSHGVSAPSS